MSVYWEQDHSNEDVQLGVTSQGLAVFQNHVKTNTFTWSKIIKISFKRKQFFIHLRKEQSDHVETVFSFSVSSYRACKNLWKSCVEYHTFLCSRQCKQTMTPWLTDGQKQDVLDLRYRSLECRHTGCSSASELESADMKQFTNTVNGPSITHMLTSASNAQPPIDHDCDDSFYCMSSPCLAVDNSNLINMPSTSEPHETVLNRSNAFRIVPPASTTNGVVSNQSDVSYRATASCQLCHNLRDKSTVCLLPTVAEQKVWMPNSTDSSNRMSASHSPVSMDQLVNNSTQLSNLSLDGHRSNSLSDQSSSSSSEVDGSVIRDHVGNTVVSSVLPATDIMQVSCTDSDKSPTESSYDLPNDSIKPLPTFSQVLPVANQNLVTVKMKPDETGRFGFNVKGGSDQLTPVIVSRVAPNTPADLCLPRLSEGDQVLFINGRDISQHTHAQVVQSIKASCEMHSGELVLVVRQNVYLGEDDSPSEPDFQYIPDTPSLASVGGDPLTASMTLLKDGLDTGTTVAQFEQLYRKKAGLTMDASQQPDNLSKNRYRDISPYDQTRVKLKGLSHDYINANYVNMEIPGSGIINRYIAAQGPLPETSHDFWEMIWDQRSSLVVMLTTNVERGRVKCHKYWPDVDEMSEFEQLTVNCTTETASDSGSYILRNFTLTHDDFPTDERQICQMQYMSWPDHGVPDDCTEFLDFVNVVRRYRAGVVESTVVHCSAGIGRTGVLIAMETAICLIEANQPVSLPDIVCQMRDQRAMLIQTASQYKFVCEAVLKVFEGELVAMQMIGRGSSLSCIGLPVQLYCKPPADFFLVDAHSTKSSSDPKARAVVTVE